MTVARLAGRFLVAGQPGGPAVAPGGRSDGVRWDSNPQRLFSQVTDLDKVTVTVSECTCVTASRSDPAPRNGHSWHTRFTASITGATIAYIAATSIVWGRVEPNTRDFGR